MSNSTIKLCILGSAESIHTVKWANFMAANSCEVILISFSAPSNLLNKNIHVEILPQFSNLIPHMTKIFFLKKFLRRSSCDLYQVHSVGSYALLGIMLGIDKFVATPWGSDILLAGKNPIKNFVIQKTISKASHFTCDSYEIRNLLVSRGAKLNEISVINFGVDTNLFRKLDKYVTREKLGFDKNQFIIISTRSLETIYDINTIINAFAEMRVSVNHAKLLLIGGGTLREELIEKVKSLNLDNDVEFLGRVENNLLVQYLNAADVYISASLSDAGIAASTAEAMACELICVITNVRENSKWIEDSTNGFLFEQRNVSELAEVLKRIYKNLENLSNLKVKARKTIVENNDYLNEMSKVLDLYRRIKSDH